jgi:hypothetical protein
VDGVRDSSSWGPVEAEDAASADAHVPEVIAGKALDADEAP